MPSDREKVDMTDVLNVIWKRKWVVFLFFSSALVSAFIFNTLATPVYRSSVSLLLGKPRYNFDFYRTGEPKIETAPLPLESVEVLESLIKDASLITKVQASLSKKGQNFSRLTVKDLMGLVKIRMDKETRILELSFDYSNPQEAAEIAAVWSGLLVDQIEDLATLEVKDTAEFVKGKLGEAKEALLRTEEAFRTFDGRSTLEMYQQQINGKVNLIRGLESRVDTYGILAHTIEDYLKKMIAEVKEKPETQNERMLANTLFLQNITAQLLEKDDALQSVQLEGLDGKVVVGGDGTVFSPQLLQFEQSWPQDYNQQVVALKALQQDIDSRATFLKQYVKEIKKELKVLKANYSNENIKKIQLLRAAEVAKTTYTVLVHKNEEVSVAQGTTTGSLKILKAASAPFEPYLPNKKRNMLVAGLIGLTCGLLLAFMKEGNG